MASIPKFNIIKKSNIEPDLSPNINANLSNVTKSKLIYDGSNSLGFGQIPEQMHRKAVKKGFNFSIMIIGESGLGKSTFVNSLLLTELYKDREVAPCAQSVTATTRIVKRFIELDEKGVKLRLTIIDTPGFSDAVNSDKCWKPIEDYINGTFEQYFKEECGLNRKNIQDNRVHCCLFFVSPLGRGLKPLDVQVIRRLQSKINIVPVIAKADSMTGDELARLKRSVLDDIERHQLDVYRLPEIESDEEAGAKKLDCEIRSCLPFSVIGSPDLVESSASSNKGTKLRGRVYPWGTPEIENNKHCDFSRLKQFLLKTHMQDLKDMTSDVLYENYRANCITERMNRRQNERQTTYSSSDGTGTLNLSDRTDDSFSDTKTELLEPGFEAIVDQENMLLHHKDEEIHRMRVLCEKLELQLRASPQKST